MESLESIAMLRWLWVCLVYQTKVCEYKNIDLNSGLRRKCESNLGSNEHYLSISEKYSGHSDMSTLVPQRS